MSATLSRIVMVIALSSLGQHRRDWAAAMLAEFRVATEEGSPLSFSLGCLMAAWREMPTHVEGRMTLTRYGLALGLLLPLATVLFSGVLAGYPYIGFPQIFPIPPHASASWTGPVNEGNLSALHALTLLFLLLSLRHAVVAWFVVERDWIRVAAAQRFGAALITTLALFAGVIVREESCVILPIATLAIELLATIAVARWHDRQQGATGFTLLV